MRANVTVLLLLSVFASARLFAAEQTTDAERLYLEARRSEDRLTQLLGERWYGLVKLQDWTDATGKFHTTAKYIEHDPGMKWVKLLAVKESAEGSVSKEVTIPLEKLDKRCQSRVRQIDHLRSKVDAAIASATEPEAEKLPNDQPLDRGTMDARMARPAGPAAESRAEPPAEHVTDPRAAATQQPVPPELERMALQVLAMQIGIEIVNPTNPLGIPSAPVSAAPLGAAPPTNPSADSPDAPPERAARGR
jgi:hypothetical protein